MSSNHIPIPLAHFISFDVFYVLLIFWICFYGHVLSSYNILIQ